MPVAGVLTIYGFQFAPGSGQSLSSLLLGVGIVTTAIFTILAVALHRFVVRPLRSIVQQYERQGGAPGGEIVPTCGLGMPVFEIERLCVILEGFRNGLADVQNDLEKAGKELRTLVDHDVLTGARNRKAYDEYLLQMPAVLRERRINVSIVLFDVYRFKAINNSYGHQKGNEILRQVVCCIGRVQRRGEHLFRVGGDEFAMILPGTDEAGALHFAERCLHEIGTEDFGVLSVRDPVRVCVAIAGASFEEGEAVAELQWRVDVAMNNAKRPGNSNISVFRAAMAQSHEGLLSNHINTAVCDAVTTGSGLVMHYQPVVDLDAGHILYYEALARINCRDELLEPSVIFPVVEARHLEVDFDLAVFRCVLEDLLAGRIQRGSGVAINLSGPAVLHRSLPEWLSPFRPLLAEYRIVLEVTETALITQTTIASENLAGLRSQGFEIALDDFGSGYSSIHSLASMPVDTVKFDISLIRGLGDETRRRIVEHMVAMLDELGHKLVAEGIEDEDTLESVRQSGFRFGQGYLFGVPSASGWRSDFDMDSTYFMPGDMRKAC